MKTTFVRFFATTATLAFATAIPAGRTAPLTIANPSFELPVFADGAFSNNVTLLDQGGSGWDLTSPTGFVGIYNPAANTYATAGGNGTPTGATGIQLGYFGQGGEVVQTLSHILTAETTYTLTLAIGRRLLGNQYGNDVYNGYAIQLLAGATVIAQEVDAVAPAPGTFVERSVVVNSATLSSALYGSALTIRLAGTQGAGVTDIDNVRLDAVTVPEPGSMSLVCAGVLGLVGWRRMRRP